MQSQRVKLLPLFAPEIGTLERHESRKNSRAWLTPRSICSVRTNQKRLNLSLVSALTSWTLCASLVFLRLHNTIALVMGRPECFQEACLVELHFCRSIGILNLTVCLVRACDETAKRTAATQIESDLSAKTENRAMTTRDLAWDPYLCCCLMHCRTRVLASLRHLRVRIRRDNSDEPKGWKPRQAWSSHNGTSSVPRQASTQNNEVAGDFVSCMQHSFDHPFVMIITSHEPSQLSRLL